MTKIDIFSGFLGAGKTTLIKKLITEAYAGEKLVLIENEFGQIGIDGGFLQDAGIQINEMNSGCICCSLVGDFSRALAQVLEEYRPDRILIEPSGVGKLSDVIRAVEGVCGEDVKLNAFVTVVDAAKCKMYGKNFGEFFFDQIENASAVILSHQGGLSEEKLSAALAIIREHNTEATVVTTPWDELDGKAILAAMEKTDTVKDELAHLLHEHEHEHHHHHHEHHHHDHDHDCDCHEHEHHHEHDHECDDPNCECHEHHHEHEHEHHHHDHDHECDCHEHHHHEHDHECDDPDCDCHEHHHEHEHHHHHDGEECHDPNCSCHHHHHHADEVFKALGAETEKRFSEAYVREILEALSEDTGAYGLVLRAKGILPTEDGKWIHFDYVPGEPDVRYGSAAVTGRLCVIGSNLDKEALEALIGVSLKG